MDPVADLGCVLRVDIQCDACKMKIMHILNSINGVYSITVDAETGTVRVSGEVDPNLLVMALARFGRHAELVWAKMDHPSLNRNYDNNDYSSYSYGDYALGAPNTYGSLDGGWYPRPQSDYRIQRRVRPTENSWYSYDPYNYNHRSDYQQRYYY